MAWFDQIIVRSYSLTLVYNLEKANFGFVNVVSDVFSHAKHNLSKGFGNLQP